MVLNWEGDWDLPEEVTTHALVELISTPPKKPHLCEGDAGV